MDMIYTLAIYYTAFILAPLALFGLVCYLCERLPVAAATTLRQIPIPRSHSPVHISNRYVPSLSPTLESQDTSDGSQPQDTPEGSQTQETQQVQTHTLRHGEEVLDDQLCAKTSSDAGSGVASDHQSIGDQRLKLAILDRFNPRSKWPSPDGSKWKPSVINAVLGPTPSPADAPFPLGDVNADWSAVLRIWTWDVPGLMRQGLFWSEDNIVPEEGSVLTSEDFHTSTAGVWEGSQRDCARAYSLVSRGDTSVHWVGSLVVAFRREAQIARFSVNGLGRRNVYRMEALEHRVFNPYQVSGDSTDLQSRSNQAGHVALCYRWEWDRTHIAFNAMFDNMPMEGWWPWPRKE